MSQIRLVPVSRAHKALIDLQLTCLPGDTPEIPEKSWWWLAVDSGGNAVGFAGMRPSDSWQKTVYLCRAGVLSEYRGKGIQKRLIRVRLAKARSFGNTHAVTDCTTENPASARSLIAAGFKPYWPQSPWALDNSIYWIRKL
jgi:ribosomal protein S18 acetylase RimI-like enzyme